MTKTNKLMKIYENIILNIVYNMSRKADNDKLLTKKNSFD